MVDAAFAPMGDLAFAEIHGFGDGVAPARAFAEPQRWGLVGRDGAWQSPPQWDGLGPICEQRAAAKSGGKHGFIDATGKWIVEPRYDLVTDFARGMAQVALADGTSPALPTDDAGRIVITPYFSGAFGIVDRAGALLHPVTSRAPVLGLRGGQELSEGRAVIQHERKYGYADLQGRVVIAAQYDYALPFSEGRARVRRGKKEGFVDLDGAEIVAAIYDGALPFSEGLAAVKKKQWGYIDRDGNVAIAPRFGPVSEFKDGRALVWIDKTRMGLLAPDGRLVWEKT